MSEPLTYDHCRCGVLDDLDDDGLCRVCAAAPHEPECICDECDEYWTCIQNGVNPKTWRSDSEERG